MTAARPAIHQREGRPSVARGHVVAGAELSSGVVRVVVGRRDDARLRVLGRGDAVLADSAVSGGLVADREAAAEALRSAFALAEQVHRAERTVIAVDSDDMRTHHVVTTFEREDSRAPLAGGEEARAVREATSDALTRAAAATEEDAALRGVPTAQLHHDVAALALDGRSLPSLDGHRGRLVEVWTDVTIAPLVLTGAATATLEAVRRRGGVVSGAYALGRLVAASGTGDAGVVRLAADATSLAIIREHRVVATRTFALGRSAIAARVGKTDDDARVWAECVIAAFHGLDGSPPGRWIFAGVPDSLLALPQALSGAVAEIRGDTVEIGPLTLALATRVYGEAELRPEDLVAAGTAALAAGVYAE